MPDQMKEYTHATVTLAILLFYEGGRASSYRREVQTRIFFYKLYVFLSNDKQFTKHLEKICTQMIIHFNKTSVWYDLRIHNTTQSTKQQIVSSYTFKVYPLKETEINNYISCHTLNIIIIINVS